MTGEIAEGHLARIRVVNGIASRARTVNLLRVEVGNKSAPILHLLAEFSGMATTDYTVRHSMLPAMRIACRERTPQPHGSPESSAFSHRLGMLAPQKSSRICIRCNEQNVSKHGFSWFRREHQLFGVDQCSIHCCDLHGLDVVDAYGESPEALQTQGRPKSLRQIQHTSSSFVGRFLSISYSYLFRDAPLATWSLHSVLSRRARSVRIRTSDSGRKPLLSDFICGRAPKEWLQRYYPRLALKPLSEKYFPIDNLLMPSNPAGPGDAYALAIAALSLNEDDGQTFFKEAASYTATPQSAHRQFGREFWEERAFLIYEECGRNVSEMARRMGMDRKHLAEKLVKMGRPNLGLTPRDI